MHYLCLLLWSLVLVAPAWALDPAINFQEDKCAAAAVYYCDNFEAHTLGTQAANGSSFWLQSYYKMRGYLIGPGGESSLEVVADAACMDSKCFRMMYPANDGGGKLAQELGFGSGFPFGITEYYLRFWNRMGAPPTPGFVYSGQSTKMLSQHDQVGRQMGQFDCMTDMGVGGIPYVGPCETVNVMLNNSLSFPGQQQQMPQNVAQQAVPAVNAWMCYELHVRLNSTPSAFDGKLELSVNDVLVSSYNNVNLDSVNTPGPKLSYLSIEGYWNCQNGDQSVHPCPPSTGLQHSIQYRMVDNLMISTAPIGCSTTTATAPNPPTGLQVQ